MHTRAIMTYVNDSSAGIQAVMVLGMKTPPVINEADGSVSWTWVVRASGNSSIIPGEVEDPSILISDGKNKNYLLGEGARD